MIQLKIIGYENQMPGTLRKNVPVSQGSREKSNMVRWSKKLFGESWYHINNLHNKEQDNPYEGIYL